MKITIPKKVVLSALVILTGCSSFTYKTYKEDNINVTDPEPDYSVTLNPEFQDFTTYMFYGNRIENFITYFNTYYNASENFEKAYEEYSGKVLEKYGEDLDNIGKKPDLSQESIDNFNKAIEKASRVIQYHKSSAFLDRAVLIAGKAYYYLGDYLKAERKFNEFVTKLSSSIYMDDALLFLAKTQLKLDNVQPAIKILESLIKNSANDQIRSESYQSLAEHQLIKKDYSSAVSNLKKAISYSDDNSFKAKLQFLLATVIAREDPTAAAKEYAKALDYKTSYELEFLIGYNLTKNLILSGNFSGARDLIENMSVKYKDNIDYLAQISFLNALLLENQNEVRKFLRAYHQVIRNYPNTPSSADAAYRLGLYFESSVKDYLNAFRYYRFSTEQSSKGVYSSAAINKKNIFQRYFELHSLISDKKINTDYDTEFKKNTMKEYREEKQGDENNGGTDEGTGKPGGVALADSITNNVDSVYIKNEQSARAKFELAELFFYQLKNNDSTKYYLENAYNQSNDYDFKAKVLFTLAEFYRSTGDLYKSDELHREVISLYPLSEIHNSSKRILNIPVEESTNRDIADSLYNSAQIKFTNRDYQSAIDDFVILINAYPQSVYIEKSLYAIGWIYENVFLKSDSAVYYYNIMISNFPRSEFAALVSEKIKIYNSYITGDTVTVNGTDENQITDPEQLLKESGENPEYQDPSNDGSLPQKDPYLKDEEVNTSLPRKK